jgi:hypothetical protein
MEGIFMSSRRHTKTHFFILTLLSGILLTGLWQVAGAQEREFRHREFRDSRYHHDHYYPARGQYFDVLPSGHRMVVFGRARYYFFDGVWYRPMGRRFLVVAPPIGLPVPFLPPYYTTIMVGGMPYYYANEIYYTAGPNGYMVVAPPTGEVIPGPPPPAVSPQGPPPGPPAGGQAPAGQMSGDQMFIYPRQGQNEKKQADDRFECHRWAAGQTGYDPTKPPVGLPEAQLFQKRGDYNRAMSACLEGRGYTVR